jgi:hypothetical protein
MSYGINLQASSFFAQGHTAGVAVNIKDNTISDVFFRQETSPRNGYGGCIYISGDPSFAGSGASAPGRANNSAGTITDLFGTGTSGNFYANNTSGGTVASPGGYFWNISGNQCLRTLPPVTAWSQWGTGSNLWVGANGSSPPYFSGAIPESALNVPALNVTGALRYSLIADNVFATTGANSIQFSSSAVSGDYDGLDIKNNIISDFATNGVYFPAATSDEVTISNNNFDGDPRLVNAARSTAGTWASTGGPTGINASGKNGLIVEFNKFRNMQAPLIYGSANQSWLMNSVFGTFNAAAGYNSANTGVGSPPSQNQGWLWVPENGNPTSSSFRQMTSSPAYSNLTVLPTTLILSQVANTGAVSGYSITNGSAQYYGGYVPSVTITAPPVGGTPATATVIGMKLYGFGTLASGGSGYAVNDIACLVGGTYNSGGGPLCIKVTGVSSGAITTYTYWTPSVSSYSVTPGNGTVTGQSPFNDTAPGGTGSGTGAYFTGETWQPTVLSYTSGAGYTNAPTISFQACSVCSTQPTGTTTISASLQVNAGAGSATFNSSGTSLGVSGTSGGPVTTVSASADASAYRVTAVAPGPTTVPFNVSLVRFVETSTIASQNIVLPTVSQDGYAIQFVPYSTITAVTFSPAVNGFVNGNSMTAYSAVRIRWDATSNGWYREQ